MNTKNTLIKLFSVMVVFGVLLAACGTPAPETAAPTDAPAATDALATEATGKIFDGVTIDILTFVGPQVAEPLQRRGPDFHRAHRCNGQYHYRAQQ